MSPGSPVSTGESEPDIQELICHWLGCGLSFDSLEELVSHLTASHVTSQHGSFYCLWQGCPREKGFNARYKMLIHIRTHTNERPYVCSLCDKRFSRQENLRIHARTHTGEKPYACTMEGCTKAYSNSSDRFKHTRTHFVDKPYECRHPGCDKRYTDPSSLRKHVKIYSHGKRSEETTPTCSFGISENLDTSLAATRLDLSPSPSSCSSLGPSPGPPAPSPSFLAPVFPVSSSAGAGNYGATGLANWPAAAAWTVAFQQIHANLILNSNEEALRRLDTIPEQDTDVHGASALDLTMCSSPLDLSLSSTRSKKT